MVQRERDQLLKEKMSVLHNMMIADRIVSLGLLAAGLSHHIRNSLVAVKNFPRPGPRQNGRRENGSQRAAQPGFLERVLSKCPVSAREDHGMLKDLWTASEKPTFSFADQVQVRTVVAEVIARFQDEFAAKGIQVENRISDSLPFD